MSEIKISLVPAEFAAQAWPKVRGILAGAIERTYGRYEPEDLLENFATGKQLLWIAYEGQEVIGAVASGYLFYPRCTVLTVDFTGGTRLREWSHAMLETLRSWGRDNGCDRIESTGRPGWAKIFETEGHKPIWHTFELPIESPAKARELEMSDG